MPINVPVTKAEAHNDGLDFVSVLRDCLSCAVITLDERQRVTAFNPRAEELAGQKSSAVLGQGPEILPAVLREIISEVFTKGQAINERRVLLPDPKRGDLMVQVSATVTRAESGKVSGAVFVLNDISSVRKWESNMRRLDRLHSIGTLSASMAHEVKNAFVAVRTFVDLLLEKNKEADLAQIVRLEMGRIDAIIGQMLRFSGPAKPALSSLHVHFVLNKSVLLVQHLLDDKKIKITRTYNAGADVVDGDQDQIEQALLNLFLNAIDAMNENGRLDISTELLPANTKIEGVALAEDKRFLRVTIRDTGTGISAENMERLFEPFFTTKPDGTGLGLAITRRIIGEHHGVISVQSELGKGTTFNLFLPSGKSVA
jgi:PAS domain S-box-containing protein